MPTIYKPEKKYRKNKTWYDSERRKIYNSERWAKLREYKIINDPLCEKCKEEGITKPAEDVHHIISFMRTDDSMQRKWLAYDYDNLMSLCKEHHADMHNKR